VQSEACPKCGSTNRERGKIFPKGSLWDVRFSSESAFGVTLKKKVVAVACSSCGYIELYLAGRDEQDVV
jgi:predicted nucleic-acid-binding Zn-ribbon protein